MYYLLGELFIGLGSLFVLLGLINWVAVFKVKVLWQGDYFYGLLGSIVFISSWLYYYLLDVDVLVSGGSFLIVNGIVYLKLFALFLFLSCLICLDKYLYFEKLICGELGLLLLLALLGNLLIIMANEFFILYLSLEFQTLILYILAALNKSSSFSVEAGLKYYVVGSVSSGLFLYGIVMVYGLFGTVDFLEVSVLLKNMVLGSNYIFIYVSSFIFILVSLFIKLGMVPFHWWLPDVYEGGPFGIVVFFLTVFKLGVIFTVFKIWVYCLSYGGNLFGYLIMGVALVSILGGLLYAMFQYNFMRFVAYSSIFNLGMVMLGLSVESVSGLVSFLFYLIPYFLSILGVLYLVSRVRINGLFLMRYLWEFSSLSFGSKGVLYCFGIFIFSLVGIPPLSLFFGKFLVIMAVWGSIGIVLGLVVLGLGVVSSIYYVRFIRFSVVNVKHGFIGFYSNGYFLVFLLFLNCGFLVFSDSLYLLCFRCVDLLYLIF